MKRTITLLLALFVIGSASFAETYPVLTPKNAVSMSLGGSFTSIPTAEFSFFGNPAAFAAKKGSLTLISTDAWAYIKPTSDNLKILSSLSDPNVNQAALAGSLMPTNNGIGGGASIGIGYAGRGLGIGVFAITDNWAEGDSVPAAVLKSDTQVSAVAGLGIPFQFGDNVRLSVGGDLRPFYRIRMDSSLADILSGSATGETIPIWASAGFGLAMDLGASLELGSLGIGLAVRDIAPPFPVCTGPSTSSRPRSSREASPRRATAPRRQSSCPASPPESRGGPSSCPASSIRPSTSSCRTPSPSSRTPTASARCST